MPPTKVFAQRRHVRANELGPDEGDDAFRFLSVFSFHTLWSGLSSAHASASPVLGFNCRRKRDLEFKCVKSGEFRDGLAWVSKKFGRVELVRRNLWLRRHGLRISQ